MTQCPGSTQAVRVLRAGRRGRRARAARHRLHLHRGPDLEPGRLPALQRHARRRAPPLGRAARRRGGAPPVQQVQRHDARRRRPNLLVCEHVTSSLVRIDPDGTAPGARCSPPTTRARSSTAQRRDHRARTGRSTSPTRRTAACRASGSSASRSSTSRACTGSRPAAASPSSLRRGRVRAAQRPVLLARRVAAVHQRHPARPHPGVRREAPTARSRTAACSSEGIGTGVIEEGDLADGMKCRRARQHLGHRARAASGCSSPTAEHLGTIEVPENVGNITWGGAGLERALHPGLDLAVPISSKVAGNRLPYMR